MSSALAAVDEMSLRHPEAGPQTRQGGVNSVEIAGALVRALAEASGPARLVDLARAIGVPSAKAHRYLVSLIRAGLVEQDRVTSLYDLGPLALRAGVAALSRSDLLRRAERRLAAIVEATGETAAAAVWGSHGPTLVRLIEARHEQASSVPLGHVCPLTYSAVGLVFCAYGDDAQRDGLIARELAQSRAAGRHGAPTTPAALSAMLDQVRAHGLATVSADRSDGLAAVSAPVVDPAGRLRLALTVFGRGGRIDVSADGSVARLMRRAATALGAELHGG